MSQLFAAGGLGASDSASVLPMNIQGWFPLGLTGLISLQRKGLSRVFSGTTVWKHQVFIIQPSLWFNSHLYLTPGKIISLTLWTIVGKVMSLLFNMLSRFVIAFHPRSKYLLMSWLQSPSTVILEPKIIKPVTVSNFSPSICCEVVELDAMMLVFECWISIQLFISSFTLINRLFSSFSLSATREVQSAYLRLLIFLLAILISACDSSSRYLHVEKGIHLNGLHPLIKRPRF